MKPYLFPIVIILIFAVFLSLIIFGLIYFFYNSTNSNTEYYFVNLEKKDTTPVDISEKMEKKEPQVFGIGIIIDIPDAQNEKKFQDLIEDLKYYVRWEETLGDEAENIPPSKRQFLVNANGREVSLKIYTLVSFRTNEDIKNNLNQIISPIELSMQLLPSRNLSFDEMEKMLIAAMEGECDRMFIIFADRELNKETMDNFINK